MSPAEAWDLIAPHAAGAAGAIVAASQAVTLPAFVRVLFAGVAAAEFGGTWLVSWAKTQESLRAAAEAQGATLAAHFAIGWAADPVLKAVRRLFQARVKAQAGDGKDE